MENFTENGHYQGTEGLYCRNVNGPHHNILIAAVNIFLSVTATFGNVLILIALHKESSLLPPSKLIFRCLAITDLGVGLISLPIYATELLLEINNLRRLCNYFVMMAEITSIVFSGVSLMTVTAISVDRLQRLSLSVRYKHVVTLRRVGAILSGFWLVSAAVSVMQRFWRLTADSKVIPTIVILCLVTSGYCYTKIFLGLRRHQAQMRDHVHQGEPSGGGTPLNVGRYRKTVYTALWIQITLVTCYLPQALMRPFEDLFYLSEVSLILGLRYTASLVFLNSSLNPLLYCWKIKEVRQAVKDTFTQYCC